MILLNFNILMNIFGIKREIAKRDRIIKSENAIGKIVGINSLDAGIITNLNFVKKKKFCKMQ